MELILIVLGFILVIFIIRLFGAWMLRIDELITNQKELLKMNRAMLSELKDLNSEKSKE